jgi:hypothetical protein
MAQGEGAGGFFEQKLVRYLIRHMITGVVVGWTILLCIIWTDMAGVGSLIHGSESGPLALTMLAFAFAITFGSAGMGIAANRLHRAEQPIRVRADRQE